MPTAALRPRSSPRSACSSTSTLGCCGWPPQRASPWSSSWVRSTVPVLSALSLVAPYSTTYSLLLFPIVMILIGPRIMSVSIKQQHPRQEVISMLFLVLFHLQIGGTM